VDEISIIDLLEGVLSSLIVRESLALGSSESGNGQNDNQSDKSLEVHLN